jgi:ABC-type phosphate transport system permease subunit
MTPLLPKRAALGVLALGVFGWIAAILVAEFADPDGIFNTFLGYFLGFVATPAIVIGLLGYLVGHKKSA